MCSCRESASGDDVDEDDVDNDNGDLGFDEDVGADDDGGGGEVGITQIVLSR